jgi:hypothetical protein
MFIIRESIEELTSVEEAKALQKQTLKSVIDSENSLDNALTSLCPLPSMSSEIIKKSQSLKAIIRCAVRLKYLYKVMIY